ncbi:hypothetical protein FHL15_009668 [Xylaria flabelliformis]|uniref:Uncharacterized protein n=1 Tax=Xylaria flabelliformis TaxID=2512241 RepID=A0A553HNK3_9PEZI|nr:hypothetical protein FHL15_009668 [Xylaria flabelliformis]
MRLSRQLQIINGTVWLWNIATGEHWLTLGGGNNEIYTCAFSAGSKTLATASRDGTIQIWDAATGVKHTTIGSKQFYKGLSFSKDGRYLKTDYGSYSLAAVSISPDTDPNSDSLNYALTIDHNWICLDKEKIVWILKEYRPTCVAYRGNTVVLGQGSGGLIILQLEHSHPRPIQPKGPDIMSDLVPQHDDNIRSNLSRLFIAAVS